jgi:hypothetical protein
MYNTYLNGVEWETPEDLEARAAALLPALFLARVDGKSPVDYLSLEADKERVRRIGRLMIQSAPHRLSVIRSAWAEELRVAG